MAAPSIELTLMEAVVDLIKTVGFPVFVALWFMIRTDKRLEDLTKAVKERR